MAAKDPFWTSRVVQKAIIGLIGAASAVALGAGFNVRDRVAAVEARQERSEAVQAERDKAIIDKLDALRVDIRALKP